MTENTPTQIAQGKDTGAVMHEAHPMPGKWYWWASFDGGETAVIGPCVTKEDAISDAFHDRLGEYQDDKGNWRNRFMVMECLDGNVDLSQFFEFSRWFESIAEEMDERDCGGNEYGEHHPLWELSDEVRAELGRDIKAALHEWQKRNKLPLRSYYFAAIRNREEIDLPAEDTQP